MTELQPLVHVGYHKTGTTWLQRELFQPSSGFSPVGSRPEVIEALIAPHHFSFDPAVARAQFEQWWSNGDQSLVPVVSMERLSGSPHFGRYDSAEIAHRLAATFPTAKVLLVIRRQHDAIVSGHRQYVKVGGARSLAGYLQPVWSNSAHQFDMAAFDYFPLVSLYDELFGTDRVCVLPYEQFRDAPVEFVRRIVEFAGLPETDEIDETVGRRRSGVAANRALSAGTVDVKRLINRVMARPSPFNPTPPIALGPLWHQRVDRRWYQLDRRVPSWFNRRADARDRSVVREAVGHRFAMSNRLLAERMDVDLAGYGYDVADPMIGGGRKNARVET